MVEWIPLLPALAAALTAVLFVLRRDNGRLAAMPVIVATGASLALSVAAFQSVARFGAQIGQIEWLRIGDFSASVGFLLDGLSALMLLVVASVALLVQVFSVGYMEGDDGFARFFAYLGLFASAMLGLVLADNLLMVYICWELVGICSYLLIGFWYRNRAPANAAKKAFIVTRFGDLGLLLGIILLWSSAHTFEIAALEKLVQTDNLKPVLLSAGAFFTVVPLLVFLGAVGKSAQFPLHVWLPDAMEGPTPVSALIHAATMVAAGVFLVARLFFLFHASPTALQTVAWIGGFTAFLAATIALVQVDIKKVLAYSTISQLGYMMLGLALGGIAVGMFHLSTHAFFKALLFLAAGSVIHACHHEQCLLRMGGLHRRMPLTSWTTLAGALALAGVFPFAGFWSKDEILASALRSPALFALALAVAGMTAFYMTRLWFLAFAGEPRSEHASHARESSAWMGVPLVLLALAALAGGAINLPGSSSLTALLEPDRQAHGFAWPVAVGGLAVALAGIAVGVRLYGRDPARDAVTRLPKGLYRFLSNKWYIDDFYERGVARAAVAWGAMVAWFDRNVVDNLVNLAAWICALVGRALGSFTNGQPQFYAAVLALMAVIAAALVGLAATGALGGILP
ncbi:MAG: NADH-quinone oxidoreductase subunit L [Fimbriimonadales bacterium]|nr:NADH-quinone oxidoreductase subunit L [Fimbriimonadales bacterium]